MIRRLQLAAYLISSSLPVLGQGSGSAAFTSGGADTCAGATPIAGYGIFVGDNIGASSDFIPICVPGFGADVFYNWTAPATASVYVTTCNPGTLFNTKMAIFETAACVGFMTGCNDDHDQGLSLDCSTVAFYATAGNVYKIMIIGSPGAASSYEMSISPATTTFCEPGLGGVQPCPCGNPPSGPGRGCNNHGAASGGASLIGAGWPVLSQDQFYLTSANENATSLTVFFTGTSLTGPAGAINGAGIRCVGGLKRLYTGNASGGTITKPGSGDQSVSARSAAVGAAIQAGQTRYYFAIYRDPHAAGPCANPLVGVNLSNALGTHWGP